MISRLSFGGFLIGALIGMALLAGTLSPQDPLSQDLDDVTLTPGHGHPMGTDALGRDVMARLVHGARISLPVAAAATLLSCLLGTIMGLISGAAGGLVDRVVMRFVDVMLAFPTLVLLLVLAALFRSDSPIAVVILLGLTTWMPLARLVRAEALSLSTQWFVEAAVSLGASPLRRAIRHIAPNVISTVAVTATLLAGDVILMEAGLSFLGLGIAPPTPTWGDMVREGMQDLAGAWWVSAFPGMTLALAVIAFNLLGDGLRDALEPRHSPRAPAAA